MSTIETGGPAFPLQSIGPEFAPGYAGMTLRDYFAAKAMQGYLASFDPHGEPVEFATKIAEDAYTLADTMLKAREAAPQKPQQ